MKARLLFGPRKGGTPNLGINSWKTFVVTIEAVSIKVERVSTLGGIYEH